MQVGGKQLTVFPVMSIVKLVVSNTWEGGKTSTALCTPSQSPIQVLTQREVGLILVSSSGTIYYKAINNHNT